MKTVFERRRPVSVRQFRARLASVLNGAQAAVIGDDYSVRGICIPIIPFNRFSTADVRRAKTAAKKAFLAALESI